MKKIQSLLLVVILLPIACLLAEAENTLTEIECSMNTQTKYSYNNQIINESIYVQKFRIDDIKKQFLIYSAGQEAPIEGLQQIFNNNEIVITDSKPSKNETLSLKIDRRSGTIFMKNTKADRWWGDIVTTYHGTCAKLDNQKF